MKTQTDVIISCSKDSFVKFWDLRTQHCFKTLTGHLGEIWSLVSLRDEQLLVTGGADSELRVWSLDWTEKAERSQGAPAKRKPGGGEETKDEEEDVRRGSGGGLDISFVIEAEPMKPLSRVWLRLTDLEAGGNVNKSSLVTGRISINRGDLDYCTAIIGYVSSSISDLQVKLLPDVFWSLTKKPVLSARKHLLYFRSVSLGYELKQ